MQRRMCRVWEGVIECQGYMSAGVVKEVAALLGERYGRVGLILWEGEWRDRCYGGITGSKGFSTDWAEGSGRRSAFLGCGDGA